jgi:hypothetical protein
MNALAYQRKHHHGKRLSALNVYACGEGDHWHVGHKPKPEPRQKQPKQPSAGELRRKLKNAERDRRKFVESLGAVYVELEQRRQNAEAVLQMLARISFAPSKGKAE